MHLVSNDRTVAQLDEQLYRLQLVGVTIDHLDVTRLHAGNNTLADLLHEYPSIDSLVLGFGLSKQVLRHLYRCNRLSRVTVRYWEGFTVAVPLPQSVSTLHLDFAFPVHNVALFSRFLDTLTKRHCRPILHLYRLHHVLHWDAFQLPACICEVCFPNDSCAALSRMLHLNGFVRVQQECGTVVYAKEGSSRFSRTTEGIGIIK